MDLSTNYLGFDLPHPLMPGASPLADDLDTVRRLEDAGAAAIVLRSLFEEQIAREQGRTTHDLESNVDAFAEARSFFAPVVNFRVGPAEYLEQVRRIRAAVKVPVIASLNGVSFKGWLEWGKLIQEAGASALELNLYSLATNPEVSGEQVEARSVEIVRAVRSTVSIPIAVKLSPFYSSIPHVARKLAAAGAGALVLFNRFYQPDIDIEALEVAPRLVLSDSTELLLRLRWIAILSGRVPVSLAASGGVHTDLDALKAVMAGASAVQLVSCLLRNGPEYLTAVRQGISRWLEDHEYDSLSQARGSMSLERCPDPTVFERMNYARVLQSLTSSR